MNLEQRIEEALELALFQLIEDLGLESKQTEIMSTCSHSFHWQTVIQQVKYELEKAQRSDS